MSEIRDVKKNNVTPTKNNQTPSKKVVYLGDRLGMVYITIKKPLDWKPPIVPGEQKTWMIDRDEYRRFMAAKREATAARAGLEVEVKKKAFYDREIVLPWAHEVSLSELVSELFEGGYHLVGTEQGFDKTKQNRMVWYTFVRKEFYRPPIKEYENVKPLAKEWLEQFFSENRMNVTISVQSMGSEKDPSAMSAIIMTDRDHAALEQVSGLYLHLGEKGLVLS